MGLDLKFVDCVINEPVFILKSAQAIPGFFCIIDTRVKIISNLAIFSGSHSTDFVCTGFIVVNSNFPIG